MTIEDLDSFDEPTILHLTRRYRLHPNACNPQMDLVVLLYLPTQEEIDEGESSSVELWRTSGEQCVKVWDRDIAGYIVGMDWSLDGLQLSLLSYPGFGYAPSPSTYSLVHLSVHDGLPLATVSIKYPHVPDKQTWVPMRWITSENSWPAIEKGSAGNIIDSLPDVEKVEPVLPPHLMYQFQPALALKARKALEVPDSTLIGFPTVPPINLALRPGILLVPSFGQELLGGTFPGSGELVMRLAQTSQRMKEIMDIVIKGINSAQASWREALKQGRLWEEELEECETAAGEPKGSAKAGLSLLLMNGQCLQSVSDFLSHRVTGRSLTKWKATVTSSLNKIHRLMVNSVIPGLERIMVLLEEMSGWAIDVKYHSLGIDAGAIEQCQVVARRLATMATLLNRDAEYKAKISHDFFDWLAYQVELINNSDYADMEIRPKYNALDVWEYLEHGLVLEQTFKRKRSVPYFETPSREPVDLTKLCPEDLQPQSADKSLLESLEGTLKLLQGQGSGTEPPSDISIELEDKPSDQSSTTGPAYHCLTDLMPELVRRCKEVIQNAKPPSASVTTLPQALVGPYVADDSSWYTGVLDPKAAPSLKKPTGVLFRESHDDQLQAACVDLSADGQILAVDCVGFFDASEITFVLSCHLDAGDCTVLATAEYQNLDFEDISQFGSLRQAWEAMPTLLSETKIEPQQLTIARSQVIHFTSSGEGQPSIAMNGRKKRRSACVLSPSGQELQVFSLWISGVDDDGDEEEEEEEEEEAVEGNDAMEH